MGQWVRCTMESGDGQTHTRFSECERSGDHVVNSLECQRVRPYLDLWGR